MEKYVEGEGEIRKGGRGGSLLSWMSFYRSPYNHFRVLLNMMCILKLLFNLRYNLLKFYLSMILKIKSHLELL
jgi:hypothetical protein